MNNLQIPEVEKDEISLEKRIDEKRQEINALQIKLRVIEAQIKERIVLIERLSAKAKSTWSTIQLISETSSLISNVVTEKKEDKEKREKNRKDLLEYQSALMQQMEIETDTLSTERIEFAKISQELENVKKDLEFFTERLNRVNNTTAWMSGSFYVFATILIITVLAVISSVLPWYSVGIIFGSGLLSIIIIGALQLRNDKNLSEENFIQLIKETLKHLPSLLKSVIPRKQ